MVVLLDTQDRAVQFSAGHTSQSRKELCVSCRERPARKGNALHLKPAGTTLRSAAKAAIVQQGPGAKHCSQTARLQASPSGQFNGWRAPTDTSHLTSYSAKPDFICEEQLQSPGLPESRMCHGDFPLIK